LLFSKKSEIIATACCSGQHAALGERLCSLRPLYRLSNLIEAGADLRTPDSDIKPKYELVVQEARQGFRYLDH